MKIRSSLSLLSAIVLLASFQDVEAQTVTWGNDLLSNSLFNSTGGFLDGSFKFEIGDFADTSSSQPGTPFDPTLEVYSGLHSFWKPIDYAVEPASSGWNPVTRTFAGSVNLAETAPGSNVAMTDGVPGSTSLFADPDLVPGGEKISFGFTTALYLAAGMPLKRACSRLDRGKRRISKC